MAQVEEQHVVARIVERLRGGQEVDIAVREGNAPGDVAQAVPQPAVHEDDGGPWPVALARDEPAAEPDAVRGLEGDVLVLQAGVGRGLAARRAPPHEHQLGQDHRLGGLACDGSHVHGASSP
jgi:hypothetical protein